MISSNRVQYHKTLVTANKYKNKLEYRVKLYITKLDNPLRKLKVKQWSLLLLYKTKNHSSLAELFLVELVNLITNKIKEVNKLIRSNS